MPLPLLALAISAFAIGTTEFVIMGLLPNVARDLSRCRFRRPACSSPAMRSASRSARRCSPC